MAETACVRTSLGRIGLVATDEGIAHVVLGLSSAAAVEQVLQATVHALPEGQRAGARRVLEAAQTEIEEFVAGTRQEFTVPVDWVVGTAFQRRVWRATLRIPYGRLRSYRWVADRVGGSQYARAVGMALGANPVPLIVPCHRVVAHDGSLGGFSCGLPVKRRLLALEGTLSQLRAR